MSYRPSIERSHVSRGGVEEEAGEAEAKADPAADQRKERAKREVELRRAAGCGWPGLWRLATIHERAIRACVQVVTAYGPIECLIAPPRISPEIRHRTMRKTSPRFSPVALARWRRLTSRSTLDLRDHEEISSEVDSFLKYPAKEWPTACWHLD